MKKSILEVYSLAVCFVTIACFAITAGLMLYQVIRIANPEFTLSTDTFEKHLDNNRYWDSTKPRCTEYEKEGCGEGGKRPAEEVLTQRRETSRAVELTSEVREAKQSFIRMLIIILIDVLVFFPHWYIAHKAREVTAC